MARREKKINFMIEREKSVGAIVFRKEGSKIYYLLLNYGNGYWGFPKGRQEKGEEDLETARREIKEETGLEDLEFIDGFKEKINYYFQRKRGNKKILIFKEAIFYLAKTQKKEIKISFEHLGYKWLPFEKAMEQLTFDNNKEVLKKANKYLNRLLYYNES